MTPSVVALMARGGSPRGCGLLGSWAGGFSPPTPSPLHSPPCPAHPPPLRLQCCSSRAFHLESWLVKSPLVREEGVFWGGLAWAHHPRGVFAGGLARPLGAARRAEVRLSGPMGGPRLLHAASGRVQRRWQCGALRLLQARLSTCLSHSAQSGCSSRSMRLQPRNLQAVGAGRGGGRLSLCGWVAVAMGHGWIGSSSGEEMGRAGSLLG